MRVKLDEGAFLPERAHDTDAGIDLRAREDAFYNVVCPICKKRFHLKPYELKRHKTHYCSKDCQNRARAECMMGRGNHQYGIKGRKNSSWKSDQKISKFGYRMVRRADHPFRGYDDFVFEHRLIAEECLLTNENSVMVFGKRYLSPDYVVHHKNGNRTDNRPENLVVMKLSDHSSMHQKENPQPRDPVTHRFVSRCATPTLEQVDELGETERGENGFGSTGR